jgi:uncharacterized protein (DUF1684 family)
MRIICLVLLFAITHQITFAQSFKNQIAEHREKYKADFVKSTRAPLKEKDFKNLDFFDADSVYSIIADIEILQNEHAFKMPTYAGTTAEYVRYAKANFKLNGKNLQLTIYRNLALAADPDYKDYLFLPFTDLTNGKESYGGGRYLDFKTSDIKNERIIIDFNKAYNPYCAYSDGYRCPIPPEGNDLAISINAGEKKYLGEKKKRVID